MQPRIYVYKITFVGQPYWYWGWHKEKKYDEYYMGSPVTNKSYWELYKPVKEVLQTFEYSEEGEILAQFYEESLIRPDLNDPLCLNEHCGGVISSRVLSGALKKKWKDPSYRAKQKAIQEDPLFKERLSKSVSESMKALWERPEYIEKMTKLQKSEEFSQVMSKASREAWKDDNRRQSQSERMREVWSNPEYRKSLSEKIASSHKSRKKKKETFKSPGENFRDESYKEKMSQKLKEKWKDPDYANSVLESREERNSLYRERAEERFQEVLNAGIDIQSFGWVSKVASLWGVSNSQVKRIFDRYWKGPAPYRRRSRNLQ